MGFKGAGIPSAIVRFIAHIIMGFQAWTALPQYQLVQRTPELQKFASKPILATKKLAAVSGMFGFWYNFVMWIPTALCPPELLWILGLIDSAIVICLAIAAKNQAEFTPRSKGRCSGDLSTWIVDGGQGLFEAVSIASHNATMTPKKECEQWNLEWIFEIIVVILYGFSALFNIVIPLVAMGGCGYRRYGRNECLSPMLLIYRLTPRPVRIRIQFWKRYLHKCIQIYRFRRRIRINGKRVVNIKTDANQWELLRVRKVLRTPQDQSSLTRFLSNFDVLVLLMRDIHYLDLVHLSLLSVSINSTLYPNMQALRRYTCDAASKTACNTCGIRVCSTCQTSRSMLQTKFDKHIQQCRPRCSKCYLNCPVLLQRSQFLYGNRWCICAGQSQYVRRGVCGDCSQVENYQLNLILEKKEGRDINRMMEEMKCVECIAPFKRGQIRWWICSKCNGECNHDCHEWWRADKRLASAALDPMTLPI